MDLQVNDIQRFSLADGPGIRTVVFLQGCPLHCWWCHNPTMQDASGPATAWDVEALARYVTRDARYWRQSEGGVTLSGGEPLLQPRAAGAFLKAMAAGGYHRCVETAGYADAETVSDLDPWISLWLFDLKTADADVFRAACGGDLGRVLSNLRHLLSRGNEAVWVRVPLIKGHNDDGQSVEKMASFLRDNPPPARIQLLPGHDLQAASAPAAAVAPEDLHRAAAILAGVHDRVEICW